MADTIDIPRGRTSSILLFALLTFGTYVLMIIPFLSQHSRYHISLIVVYTWEIILFSAGLVAMVLLIVLRKNNEHLMMTQSTLSSKQRVTRYILFVLFGVSASILPFYESKQVSTCMFVDDKAFHKLQFASQLCTGVYTVFHGIFAPLCYKFKCKSVATRLLVVIILSANATLLGNSVLNTMRSLNTQPSQDPSKHHSGNATLYGAADMAYKSSKNYFSHTLVYSVCVNGTETIDHSSATLQVHEYTYPLMLQFLLFSLIVLVPLWNIVARRQTNPANINTDVLTTSTEQTEHTQEQNDTQSLDPSSSFRVYTRRARILYSMKRAIRFISQYSIVFSSICAITFFVLRLLVEVPSNVYKDFETGNSSKNLTSYDLESYYLQTIYTYIISLVPFIGYFVARQQQIPNITWRFDVETALLFVGGCGYIMWIVFETVDSITVLSHHPTSHVTEDVMYFIKIILHYLGIYFQIKFIIKSSRLQIGTGNIPDQKVHVQGIITFLGISNAECWLADSVMPPSILRYADDIQGDDTFGHANWRLIVQNLFPVVIFYELWSAIMCFKTYDILKQRNQSLIKHD